jgi:hypothetical protein
VDHESIVIGWNSLSLGWNEAMGDAAASGKGERDEQRPAVSTASHCSHVFPRASAATQRPVALGCARSL